MHAQDVALYDLLHGHDGLLPVAYHAGSPRRELHERLDALARAIRRIVLQKRADLHDKSHLAGGKPLSGVDGGHERHRHEHVGGHVMIAHEPYDGANQDRRAA